MDKKTILNNILSIGIVPIVRCDSTEDALAAVDAVYEGGIRAVEITMTVPGAIQALEKVADRFAEIAQNFRDEPEDE